MSVAQVKDKPNTVKQRALLLSHLMGTVLHGTEDSQESGALLLANKMQDADKTIEKVTKVVMWQQKKPFSFFPGNRYE